MKTTLPLEERASNAVVALLKLAKQHYDWLEKARAAGIEIDDEYWTTIEDIALDLLGVPAENTPKIVEDSTGSHEESWDDEIHFSRDGFLDALFHQVLKNGDIEGFLRDLAQEGWEIKPEDNA